MKVMTQAKATTEQANSAIKGARDQASSAVKDARKQTSSTVRAARKEARRQLVRARIGAARARAGARTSTAGASKKAVGAAGAAGLAAGYFLTKRQADYRAGQVEGKIEAAKHATDGERLAPNDQALAERVKSEIFQPADAPKSSVNVNVEHGIVYLRGEVKRPDQIRELVEHAGAVDGVAGVENLLHTP